MQRDGGGVVPGPGQQGGQPQAEYQLVGTAAAEFYTGSKTNETSAMRMFHLQDS